MRSHQPVARREERAATAALARDLSALETSTISELSAQYLRLFDEPTRSRNREYLIKRIGWRIQELAEGGLSPHALAQIDKLAPLAPVKWRQSLPTQAGGGPSATRDARLPAPGELIRRVEGGVEHRVKVLERGFEYEGKVFRSLSGIAKQITGVQWNGYRYFFGCADSADAEKAGGQ